MGSSGNKRCGILSGIFGSLVTLGIGIVIGLYAIGESMRVETFGSRSLTMHLDECDICPSLGFVPEKDRVPIQLRRTTFVVYNMTRSRAFYEDGLGMVPIYGKIFQNFKLFKILFKDKIIKTPNDAETIEESEKWRHLVFLRSNNEEIGVLGLLSYIKPDAGPEGKCRPGSFRPSIRKWAVRPFNLEAWESEVK